MRLILIILAASIVGCQSEKKSKLEEVQSIMSNTMSAVEHAQDARKVADQLKDLTPLTNENLKEWLPEEILGMKRTGFKVGNPGYMNVSSLSGTYKKDSRQFKVEVIDGAGESGSMLLSGIHMANRMEVEEEDENKHMQTVEHKGIRAQQTYFKKRGDTKLQFVFMDRFGVIVNTKDIAPEECWDLVEALSLESLNP
ncbi:hypothetical protein ACT6NV_10155 [Robiginitalea sp. IMCC44478]|uniref:hypothetical protein n=1 Tax=Robiginitalea sp. IMCC44478 TaxID=3459122 RepID=UPI0040418E65